MQKRCKEVQRKLRFGFWIFLCSGMLLLLLLVRLDRRMRPAVLASCETACKAEAFRQIGDSIQSVMAAYPAQESTFAVLLYDEKGNVTAVEMLSDAINQVQTAILQQVNADLQAHKHTEISVSLGTSTGVWFFAGRGPSLKVRIVPMGAAEVRLVSETETVGINQTCHRISAEVTVTLQAAAPFYTTTTHTTFTYLLTETLILGNVPQQYTVFGERVVN